MTLKEKLNKNNLVANNLEKIADEFAIGFAEWILKQSPIRLSKPTGIDNTYTRKPTKELLEIYKKENEL